MLAGDGTKIGIQPSRQLQNERRYKNDLPIKEPLHRYDRTFFHYFRDPGNVNLNESLRILRTNTAKFFSSVLGSGQFIDQTVFNDLVLEGFPARAWLLFSRLLNGEMDKRESKSCAGLFLLLCKDASLSSILPVKLIPLLDTYLLNVSGHTTSTVADALEMVCPEISLCIVASAYSNEEKLVPKQDVLDLLGYLKDRVFQICGDFVESENVFPLPDSYNPPELGRAYYFREDSLQVRELRQFSIDKENEGKTKVVDDDPLGGQYSKFYTKSTGKGNVTQLFLWFCPRHGCCYGFHIIHGSEGRKDPSFSLYTHMEKAPEIIFYDFACGFEEYCLNRESGFYGHSKDEKMGLLVQ